MERMEKVRKPRFRINKRLALLALIVVVWSLPLFLPVGTLERYALEEVRIVIVFTTVGYYLGKRDGEKEAERLRRERQ